MLLFRLLSIIVAIGLFVAAYIVYRNQAAYEEQLIARGITADRLPTAFGHEGTVAVVAIALIFVVWGVRPNRVVR